MRVCKGCSEGGEEGLESSEGVCVCVCGGGGGGH